MAIWGKRTALINKYDPPSTMYYDYHTASDSYYIKSAYHEDFGLGIERYEKEYRFGPEYGRCLMEAFIHHILQFDYSGDVEQFVKECVLQNRFNKTQEE